MEYIWIALAGGAAAFAHCLGMCGGFALNLARGGSRAGALGRQLLWHAGKITTYLFLGAIAGFLGASLTGASRLPWLHPLLAATAMVVSSLTVLGNSLRIQAEPTEVQGSKSQVQG